MVLLVAAGLIQLSGFGRHHASAPPAPCRLEACRAAQTKIPLRAFEGAYVAADPTNPLHVVVTDTDLINAKCTWHTTFDGGKSWTDGVFAEPDGFTGCRIDAPSGGHVPSGSVVIGQYGQIYAVFGSAAATDDGRESVLLSSSVDGGRTFLPAKVAEAPPDATTALARPLMTLARNGTGADALLLSFWGCHRTTEGDACDKALFARSNDAGATWTQPILVNRPPGGQNPSAPVVGSRGTVFLTFQRRYPDGHVDLFLARSDDNGGTFTETKVDTEKDLGFAYDSAKVAVNPKTNTLYAAWSDARTGSQQIFFRQSTDEGAHWTQDQLMSPATQTITGSSRSPSIAIAPGGRIDIVYYHTPPEDPTIDDVFVQSSTDNGQTFILRQVNPRPIDRTLGLSGPSNSLGLVGNHYPPTLASLDSRAYVVWSDTSNATQLTHTQDVNIRSIVFTTTIGGG